METVSEGEGEGGGKKKKNEIKTQESFNRL